jgi:hypothetical protein
MRTNKSEQKKKKLENIRNCLPSITSKQRKKIKKERKGSGLKTMGKLEHEERKNKRRKEKKS